jgi:hypothetical protein
MPRRTVLIGSFEGLDYFSAVVTGGELVLHKPAQQEGA